MAIPFILAALAGVIVTVVVLAMLNIRDIIDWFLGRRKIKNKEDVAFTLQEKLQNGNYKTIQGIFDVENNEIKEGVSYESEEIDSDLANAHKNNDLVLYN